jgi:hypothetical protein
LFPVQPPCGSRTHVTDDLLDRVDTELVDTVSAGLTGDGDLRVVDAERRRGQPYDSHQHYESATHDYSHLVRSGVSDISRSESKDTLDQVVVVLVVVVLLIVVTLGLVLHLLHLLLSIVLPLVGRSGDGEGGQSQEEDGRETHYV